MKKRSMRCGLAVAVLLGASAPALADKSDDLSLLPVDAEVVGGLDFQQLQASTLFKNLVGPALAKNDVQKSLAEFQAECGVDPMKVVTKISFGIKMVNDKPDGVLVAHGVPKAKMIACYDKMSKKKQPDADITRDGDVLIVRPKNATTTSGKKCTQGKACGDSCISATEVCTKGGDEAVAFNFVDDSTLIVGFGSKGNKDGIKAVAKGTSALKTSATFVQFFKKTNTSDTMWMIVNGSLKALAPMAQLGIKPRAIYGSLNVTKDLNLDVKFNMKTAAEATNLSQLMNTQAKPAAGMVDKLTIAAIDTDVSIKLLLSDAKLKALATQFGGMLGGGKP